MLHGAPIILPSAVSEISLTALLTLSGVLEQIATFAPSSANKFAILLPMPAVEPVMRTFLFLRPKSISYSFD